MAVGEVYQESGKFTIGGVAVTAVVATLSGALSGFLYGIVDQVNPFIYVNALGALFVGLLVAGGAGYGAHIGKVRNSKAVAACAVIGGVVCLWAAWVGWFWAISDWELILADSPRGLWAMIQIVNLKGAWSIKGGTPTGGFLWFVWGCEALMVLGLAGIGGLGFLDDSPFCEQCGVWADSESEATLQTPEDLQGMTAAMVSGDFSRLAALPAGDPSGPHWIEAKLRACPGQGAPYFLSVTAKVRTRNDKGEEEIKDHSLVKLLEVDAATAEIVRIGGASGAAAQAQVQAGAEEGEAEGVEIPAC